MDWLNYHHLLYFWAVARERSLTGASDRLRLAPSTVSGQIRTLERQIGDRLFVRQGRGLALTEVGRIVFRYADELFAVGRELQDVLKGRPSTRLARLEVGVADVIPKLVAHRLLQPALRMPEPVRILCREGPTRRLLAELAVHELDVVLSDTSVPAWMGLRAFNHLLGECGTTFLARGNLARRVRRGFPRSLDRIPLLLPTAAASLRRALDEWFDANSIRPLVVGEFDDSALLKAFGSAGVGVFPIASVIADQAAKQYRVARVGNLDGVRHRFYAITIERKLLHPGVAEITKAARRDVFA